MPVMRWVAPVLVAGTLLPRADDSGTDPAHKHAWGENVGWANTSPTNVGQTVTVRFDGDAGWLSGYAWGENIGWIKMGSDAGGPYGNTTTNNWGVNLGSNGNLSGYAWSENVGWINFGSTHSDVMIDPVTGLFAGHAWGENIGWLKFSGSSPDYGVRTLAFDGQPQGTPNWWLDHYAVSEMYDAGDGVPAWRKYVMDTDPNVNGSYLRITAVSNTPSGTVVEFFPASSRRYYTLKQVSDLMDGSWSSVTGQVAVQYGGGGGVGTMQDTNMAARMFYTVDVKVTP